MKRFLVSFLTIFLAAHVAFAQDMGPDVGTDVGSADMSADSGSVEDAGTTDTGADSAADVPSFFTVDGQVSLDGTAGGFAAQIALTSDAFSQNVVTDNRGAFSLREIPSGTYTLTVSFPEYETFEDTAFVIDGNRFVDVTLFQDIQGEVVLNFQESGTVHVLISGDRGVAVDEIVDVDDDPVSFTIPVADYTIALDNGDNDSVDFETPLVMRRTADQTYEFSIAFADIPERKVDIDTQCACSSLDDSKTYWWSALGFMMLALVRLRRRC